MLSDMGELMHHGASAENRPVVDIGLAGNSHVTHEDAMLAHAAVMRDMDIRHNEGVVADLGNAFSAGLGAAVDSSALADGHVIANLDVCDFTVELEILGNCRNDCAGEDFAMLTYLRIRKDGCMGIYLGIITDFDVFVDKRIGPDLHVLTELGERTDACQRMYVCHI